MHALTLSRPDLCLDSTHYSWPVNLAIIDQWVSDVCPVYHRVKRERNC